MLAAITLILMWKLVYSKHHKWSRLFAALPVLVTLFILFYTYNSNTEPGILHLPLNINSNFQKTTNALGIILIICSFLIVPALGYLLYKFELPPYKPTKTVGESD